MILSYVCSEDISLFDFLSLKGYSKKRIIEFRKKGILINGMEALRDAVLKKGDCVDVHILGETSDIPLSHKPIEIVYEDDYLLVVYKEANLAIMGTKAHYEDNLSSRVMAYFHDNNIESTIHLVNRLDYGTQGLVVIAKSGFIHALFSKTEIVKKYYAKVMGTLVSGIIEAPIKRGEGMKRIVDINGQPSKTGYKVIKQESDYSIVDCTLFTGRTHQIRVHFSYLGHPLVGDVLYNGPKGDFFLESYYISFVHPVLLKKMEFSLSKIKE